MSDNDREPIAQVYAQEGLCNHATLAKSARRYSTKRGALKAAQQVANLGALQID